MITVYVTREWHTCIFGNQRTTFKSCLSPSTLQGPSPTKPSAGPGAVHFSLGRNHTAVRQHSIDLTIDLVIEFKSSFISIYLWPTSSILCLMIPVRLAVVTKNCGLSIQVQNMFWCADIFITKTQFSIYFKVQYISLNIRYRWISSTPSTVQN